MLWCPHLDSWDQVILLPQPLEYLARQVCTATPNSMSGMSLKSPQCHLPFKPLTHTSLRLTTR